MIQLNQSNVVFDEVKHTYELNGKPLNGITHIIKDKLFPDEYKDVPESVLANAANRGHRIHTALELYDTVDIYTEECPELANYIKAREQFPWLANHIASEYIVTDGEKYASGIDKVYEGENGGVILADVKTTYKVPMKYVAWQLSIYAYFFSLMNPNVPVEKAYVIWLREDKHLISEVNLVDVELVKQLLYTDEIPQLPENRIGIDEEYLLGLKKRAEEATAAYEEAKQQLMEFMTENKVTKYEGQLFTVSVRAGGERKSFDSKSFKTEYPDLYEQYVKTSASKPTIAIRMKDNG